MTLHGVPTFDEGNVEIILASMPLQYSYPPPETECTEKFGIRVFSIER
jgi:hypothetical protein